MSYENIEWISVEDKMPELAQYVVMLCLVDHREPFTKEHPLIYSSIGYLCCSQGWVFRNPNDMGQCGRPKITHWFPFPDIPKH